MAPTRRFAVSVLMFLCACGSGSPVDGGITDAGPDSGANDSGMHDSGVTDAGEDAGSDDGGLGCDGGVLIDSTEAGGGRIPPPSDDGVVGVPSTVWRFAQLQPIPSSPPVPLACIHLEVTGPGGAPVPSTLSADSVYPQKVTATFLPATAGSYSVSIAIVNGATFSDTVVVYDSDPPDLTLPRSCGSVVSASGYLGCDEALFARDGSVVATLDGGRWISAGAQLLAFEGGALAFATVEDAGVSFGPSSPAPEPFSWSSFGDRLAVSSLSAGTVYAIDGGWLSATGSVAPGWLDVLSNGTVLSLALDQPGSPFGQLFAANADQLVSWVGLDAHSNGMLGCFAPDAGGSASVSACGAPFSPEYYQQVNGWRLPRRALGVTTRGVRLPGTGAMYLPSAVQITDGDDFVWQASSNQTAIWFQ